LLQYETLYVYTAVTHYTVDKSNATYVTIQTIKEIDIEKTSIILEHRSVLLWKMHQHLERLTKYL